MASSLFNLRADSPHVQPLSSSSLVFPLVLDPQLHAPYISSPSHRHLFATHDRTCLVQSPGGNDCLGRSVRLPASHCPVGSPGLSRRVARQQSVSMHCLAGTLLGMFDYYDNGCFKMLNLPGTCPKSFQFSKSLAHGWSGPVKPDQLAFVKSSLL